MIADGSSLPSSKRRRLLNGDYLDPDAAAVQVKLAIKEKFGRDLSVFETFSHVSKEKTDDFYRLNAEGYQEILATRKEEKTLKTRKIRGAEESAHKSRIRKIGIKVRFPDNHTLELGFHSSEKMQSLFDILKKVVARPELPFYIFTAPPKKLVENLSEDFSSAGFIPGAIVYFSYHLPRGDDTAAIYSGPFLREEIMALKGLNVISESAENMMQ